MKNPDFCIRQATREDAALILSFIKKIADYEKMRDQVVATEETLLEFVFDKKNAEVLIGEYQGTPVGFALYYMNFSTFIGRTGMYLEDLFVDPAMRGKGFGKALFQVVAAEAHKRGCKRMEWSCLDWNQPSIDFYRSMGAVAMEEWTVYRLAGDSIRAAAEKE